METKAPEDERYQSGLDAEPEPDSEHQSFARKLMELQSTAQTLREAMSQTLVEPAKREQPKPVSFKAALNETPRIRAAPLLPPSSPPSVPLQASLEAVRRYAFLTATTYVAALGASLVLAAISSLALALYLASGSSLEGLAIVGAFVILAVASVAGLLYRPPLSQHAAALQAGRLEAAQLYLEQSLDFWQRFLADDTRAKTADDVATAVRSLAEAGERILSILVPPAEPRKETLAPVVPVPPSVGQPQPRVDRIAGKY